MGHTRTTPSTSVDLETLDRQHRRRGFFSFKYHYLINRNGSIEKGRDVAEHGAGPLYSSTDSVFVVLAGGINLDGIFEDNFTPEQKQSLQVLTALLLESYPNATLKMAKDMELS